MSTRSITSRTASCSCLASAGGLVAGLALSMTAAVSAAGEAPPVPTGTPPSEAQLTTEPVDEGERFISLFETETFDLILPGLEAAAAASGTSPFDLLGRATFVQLETGTVRRTPLYFDGDDTWRFRFTPDEPGRWFFTTEGAVDPLCAECWVPAAFSGHRGFVTVADDPEAIGFVVPAGPAWARQRGAGGIEAFVPQFVMAPVDLRRYAEPVFLDRVLDTFIDGHGFTGIHIHTLGGRWFDLDSVTDGEGRAVDFDVTGDEPDLRTFAILETIIEAVHDRGAASHLWEWGDTERGWTMDGNGEGQNGREHRRLLRYIAGRLGPLPGWSMGYGFDLDEWASPATVSTRSNYLNQWSGWPHVLGGRSPGPNFGFDHSLDALWHTGEVYAGYEHHEPSYAVMIGAMTARADGEQLRSPVMSEDRFRARFNGLNKDFTFDQTVELLWLSTLVGGISSIYGNLDDPDGVDIGSYNGSLPYPNAEEIRTFKRFFYDGRRLRIGARPFNGLTAYSDDAAFDRELDTPGAYASLDPLTRLAIVYAQSTSDVTLNLERLGTDPMWTGGVRITAVDTRLPYAEIELGVFPLEDTVLDLTAHGPATDWVLSIEPIRTGGLGPVLAADPTVSGILEPDEGSGGVAALGPGTVGFIERWGLGHEAADLDRDGRVTVADLLLGLTRVDLD